MKTAIQETFDKGVEMHKAGQLDLAKQLYAAVILLEPQHADANHNLGVIEVVVENFEKAIPLLRIALEENPDQLQYWITYIETLIKLGTLDEAREVLNQAKERGATEKEFQQLEQRLNGLEETSASTV